VFALAKAKFWARVWPSKAGTEAQILPWELAPYSFEVDWFAGTEDKPAEKLGSSTMCQRIPYVGSSQSRDGGSGKGVLTLAWSNPRIVADESSAWPLHVPSDHPIWRTLW
jgi:hypothetical protein